MKQIFSSKRKISIKIKKRNKNIHTKVFRFFFISPCSSSRCRYFSDLRRHFKDFIDDYQPKKYGFEVHKNHFYYLQEFYDYFDCSQLNDEAFKRAKKDISYFFQDDSTRLVRMIAPSKNS